MDSALEHNYITLDDYNYYDMLRSIRWEGETPWVRTIVPN